MESATSRPRLRKTRFVCVSDTHNSQVKLPAGDVLIHAGDLTNKGSYSELAKAVNWLEHANFEAKIVVAGNHDITLDEGFYEQHGLHHHNQAPQSPAECISLLANSPTLTYLNHSSTSIRLVSPTGPRTAFTIFGSPYSPEHQTGKWAFSYPAVQQPDPAAELPALWDDAIPLSADIVVTHTPPHTRLGERADRRAVGCEALRRALWRVRPRLAVCGHIHEGRGVERVRWRLGGSSGAFEEEGREAWEDPGTGGKLSLVDLTGKRGRKLENDGSHPTYPSQEDSEESRAGGQPVLEGETGQDSQSGNEAQDLAGDLPTCGTRGLRGSSISPRRHQVALDGRMGRGETCIVNCAIVANSYPHVGGKRYNKPIVVDLELPVWENGD